MKITLIGHASMLVETAGVTVLTDPWWNGPSFGEQWWGYPRPRPQAIEGKRIDYIYLSHGHHDHCHFDTLGMLPRDAKVLVSSTGDLAGGVRDLGFTVIEVQPDEEVALSERVRIRLIPTHNDDTLLALADGDEVCINLNDALHSGPVEVQDRFLGLLKGQYPRVDYVFCGYGIASHFPNCYRIPGKDMAATAGERQKHFNRQWAKIVAALAPRYAFPFAADVVFLEHDLQWANEPTQNTERPLAALARDYPDFRGQAIDAGPGFCIENGKIVTDIRRTPISLAKLIADLPDEVARANRIAPVTAAEVADLAELLRAQVEKLRDYLAVYAGDYLFLVRLRTAREGIEIRKTGTNVSVRAIPDAERPTAVPDVTFTSRADYVRASISEPYGDEVIFVGSGGIFELRSPEQAARNLQRELVTILRRHEFVPVRSAPPSRLIAKAKQIVKKLVRPEESDLYDLGRWTVYR